VIYVPDTVTSIADNAFDTSIIIITPSGSFAAQWAQNHLIAYFTEN